MLPKKRPGRTPSVSQRVRILPATALSLKRLAQRYGIRFNRTGVLLDMFCGALHSIEGATVPKRTWGRGLQGQLNAAQVRTIRASKDKILSVAVAHGVSERLVVYIRARKIYRWVR